MSASDAFDVVICGYGGAGAAAAIEAHDAGASVLVLEKMETGGGSTAQSGGSIVTIRDIDGAIEHYLILTEGRTPRAVLEAHVRGASQLPAWIAACGGETTDLNLATFAFPARYRGSAYHARPHGDAIGTRLRLDEPGIDHGGTTLWNMLRRNVEARDIEVRCGTRARELLQGPGGEIVGVEVETADRTSQIHARRGVILTCGGFAFRPDMLMENLGIEIPAFGPPGRNTGDGIDMALRAGAQLWHMNSIAGAFGYRLPNSEAAWLTIVQAFGFFVVDQRGRRFMDETRAEQHAAGFAMLTRDYASGNFERIPGLLIFDDTTRKAGPIGSREFGPNRLLPWSDDNAVELGNGWIAQADTPGDLGAALGLDAAASDELAQTTEAFNRAATEGNDAFGRDPKLIVPLQPPFCGIPIYPALINTQGGPRRDEQARVVGVDGRPIPRLFSAGELGSIWASLYPGAGNITEALVFGRLAGRQAASLSPVEAVTSAGPALEQPGADDV